MDWFAQANGGMGPVAARRHLVSTLLRLGINLLAIWLVTFLVIQLAPGGPVDQLLPRFYDNGEIDGPPTPGIR
jgi:ABC-type microcin C transport system permease subunit YejB